MHDTQLLLPFLAGPVCLCIWASNARGTMRRVLPTSILPTLWKVS